MPLSHHIAITADSGSGTRRKVTLTVADTSEHPPPLLVSFPPGMAPDAPTGKQHRGAERRQPRFTLMVNTTEVGAAQRPTRVRCNMPRACEMEQRQAVFVCCAAPRRQRRAAVADAAMVAACCPAQL
jgi:hypothetical protein